MRNTNYDQEIYKQPEIHSMNMKKFSRFLSMIFIFALILSVSAGCDFSEPVKVGDYKAPTNAATVAPQVEKNAFTIGEIAELKDVQVVLLDVIESTGSAYNTPEDGNIFILCEFEITNTSNKEITVSSMLSFEAYCDDYACSESFSALIEKGNRSQLDGTVAAGKKMKGVIGYEVPADWSKIEIHYTPDIWSSKEITFVATNN